MREGDSSPMMVVAAPAAAPAMSHLLMVGSSKRDSMNRPTMIQPCILKAFSGMIPNVRDTRPVFTGSRNNMKSDTIVHLARNFHV